MGAVYNCGDPAIENVVILDCGAFKGEQGPTCQHCLGQFDGATVTVENRCLARLATLKRGELQPMLGPLKQRADIFVTAASGKLVPRPDWLDHPLTAE